MGIPCPQCNMRFAETLAQNITHLNDFHRWTREAIADWLEPLEVAYEQEQAAKCVTVASALEPVSL